MDASKAINDRIKNFTPSELAEFIAASKEKKEETLSTPQLLKICD